MHKYERVVKRARIVHYCVCVGVAVRYVNYRTNNGNVQEGESRYDVDSAVQDGRKFAIGHVGSRAVCKPYGSDFVVFL